MLGNKGSKAVPENDTKVWCFNIEDVDVETLFGSVDDTINAKKFFTLKLKENMCYGTY